jgi:hypothetical protein
MLVYPPQNPGQTNFNSLRGAPQRRYKIEHAVGAGHFTRAYLATDIESNTKVGLIMF